MMQLTEQEIWKRYAMLLSIRGGSSNTNISEYLGQCRLFGKDLDESNHNYEGTAAQIVPIRDERANWLLRTSDSTR